MTSNVVVLRNARKAWVSVASLSQTKSEKPQKIMLYDNGGEDREWDLRFLKYLKIEIQILNSLDPTKSLVRDGNIADLYTPSPGVRGIALEYGVGQKQAEEWWNIN